MATHNPLVVATLERSQVLIMERDEEDGLEVTKPQQNPKGMGIAALLTSDVYGLRSQLDPPTLQLLDRKRELASRDDLTNSERSELARLNQELEKMGFVNTVRDPLYAPFVDAMTAFENAEGMQTILLTEEERARRKEVAHSIVRRFKTELQQGQ